MQQLRTREARATGTAHGTGGTGGAHPGAAGAAPSAALLDAVPAQRATASSGCGSTAASVPGRTAVAGAGPAAESGAGTGTGAAAESAPQAVPGVARPAVPGGAPARWRRLARLLPTPAGTPFTFGYGLILLATSLFAEYGDPGTVTALLNGSSTDVAHLVRAPLLVLVASALWVAGGLLSPYAVGFVVVLTALERRIGAWRTAAVFLVGHVVATLATEIPVGLSVLAGHLPATSLHRLDYGISFGLMASVGALAGLLTPVVRGAVLAWVSLMLLQDLVRFEDPLTNWGHPLALLVGIACWQPVRRVARRR
ncbi:rhomboid-like protein [Streptomyces sp. HMX112]|uniref:rhomboid-like protein n=1 Tax=Streptomyces sp. HMX112 TaxID=3390850 RepID=UPI003A7FD90E